MKYGRETLSVAMFMEADTQMRWKILDRVAHFQVGGTPHAVTLFLGEDLSQAPNIVYRLRMVLEELQNELDKQGFTTT